MESAEGCPLLGEAHGMLGTVVLKARRDCRDWKTQVEMVLIATRRPDGAPVHVGNCSRLGAERHRCRPGRRCCPCDHVGRSLGPRVMAAVAVVVRKGE